jgi:catechol 2,3-dioxygenase-like lactoylglutathione lyase family enzyme
VAVEFYAGILDVPHERVSPGRHYFHCDGAILAVVSEQSGLSRTFRPNYDHIYVSVDVLDAAYARCKTATGGTFGVDGQSPGIAQRPWGERSFYVQDPFGNPLCFVEAGTEFTGAG